MPQFSNEQVKLGHYPACEWFTRVSCGRCVPCGFLVCGTVGIWLSRKSEIGPLRQFCPSQLARERAPEGREQWQPRPEGLVRRWEQRSPSGAAQKTRTVIPADQ